ncbi:MAG: radical SAM protein [Clostridia bacterium]|nr:radical SAM protein [Clostridia bacterium]
MIRSYLAFDQYKRARWKKEKSGMFKAPVVKIIDSSVVDGPGNRAAVFLQGCNFNCKFCHNPETIDAKFCPDTLRFMSVLEVLDQVEKSMPFIRGLTISGGECMLYEDFVLQLCREAKRRLGQGFSCMLDSNGSLPFDKVLPHIDGVMLDIKAFDESSHRELAGAPNELVLLQAVTLAKAGKLTELRTVVFQDTSFAQNCITGMAEILRQALGDSALKSIPYKLIKYRPKGVRIEYLKELKVPTDIQMEFLRDVAEEEGFLPVIIV